MNPSKVQTGDLLHTKSGRLGRTAGLRKGSWTLKVLAKAKRLYSWGFRKHEFLVSWNGNVPVWCGEHEIRKATKGIK